MRRAAGDRRPEGYVPVVYHEYDPLLLVSGIPHAHGESPHFGRYRLNELGFRSPPIGPKTRRRVVVIGGSAVWGSGASDNSTTFPAQLESIANTELGHEVEVVNAGCGSYVSFQELILIAHRLVYLDPDVVIVFDGYNDVYLGSRVPPERFAPNEPDTYRLLKDFLLRNTGRIEGKVDATRRRLLYRRSFDQQYLAEGDERFVFNHEVLQNYFVNIEMMVDLLRGRGVEVVLALQPYLPLSGKPRTPEEETFLERERARGDKVSVFETSYRLLEAELTTIAAARGATFRSFRSVFDSVGEQCFFDAIHPNDVGYRRIATELGRILPGREAALA